MGGSINRGLVGLISPLSRHENGNLVAEWVESVTLLVVSAVKVLLEDVFEFSVTNLVLGSVFGV